MALWAAVGSGASAGSRKANEPVDGGAMRETASAALRRASPAEEAAWCKAFGAPPSVPRQRGQIWGAAWQKHGAYMDKLQDAFAQSFGRTPTGQQSHDIPLLSFAEGRTRQVLTQTAKRVERYWELASWHMTAIHLPAMVAKREYDACRDAVRQEDKAWDSALEALGAAGEPVEELLRAAPNGADQSGIADDALFDVSLMQLKLMFRRDSLFKLLDEAERQRFDDARRDCQAKLLAAQDAANQSVIAAYNDALEKVATTLYRFNAAYTALWQQGERIVVLLHAKGEYRDPNDLTVRLMGRAAQVRGVPVVRVTFERSKARERLLQTAGQAYHDQVQTDVISGERDRHTDPLAGSAVAVR